MRIFLFLSLMAVTPSFGVVCGKLVASVHDLIPHPFFAVGTLQTGFFTKNKDIAFIAGPNEFFLDPFSDGVAVIGNKEGGYYGYVDHRGNVVIPIKYKGASPFREGLALVKDKETYFFISLANEMVGPRVDWASNFKNGYAVVRPNKAAEKPYSLLSREGKIVSGAYNSLDDVNEGLAAAGLKKNGITLSGFIDPSGETVIPFQYTGAHSFSEGLAPVRENSQNSKWGFIDKTNQVKIPFQFEDARSFSQGLAAVKFKNEKWGYIDRQGNISIGAHYRLANSFKDGLAAVSLLPNSGGHQWGYINLMGQLVIPGPFSLANNFYLGWAYVETGEGSPALLDKQGNLVRAESVVTPEAIEKLKNLKPGE